MKNQTKNREVWEEAYGRVISFIESGKTVVFDATLADERTRNNFIKLVKENGVDNIQGLYVDVPLETAKERNAKRDRVVPQFVLDLMHENLSKNPPSVEEGFSAIFTLDEY